MIIVIRNIIFIIQANHEEIKIEYKILSVHTKNQTELNKSKNTLISFFF